MPEEPFVKPEKFLYKMKLEKCHKCIVQNPVVDPNEDDYIRRELNGKLVFFHGICYKTWKSNQVV